MASLEKYNQPLDNRLAKHLLRRTCFHYSQELLNESEGKTPEQVLSILKKTKSFFGTGLMMLYRMDKIRHARVKHTHHGSKTLVGLTVNILVDRTEKELL